MEASESSQTSQAPLNDETLITSPHQFWEGIHSKNMEGVKKLTEEAAKRFAVSVDYYFHHLTLIIEIQSKELSIFREMETRIRSQNMSEEQLTSVMVRLNELRKEVKALNTAAASAPAS